MALVSHQQQNISRRVNDRTIGATIFGQLATYRNLIHTQTAGGADRVQVVVNVDYYSIDSSGNLGPKIEAPGISSYVVNLVADNDTIVDAGTGEILSVRSNESDEEWTGKANGFSQAVDFQGNFFNKICFNQPVLIAGMIQQHIENANAMGRFN